MSGYGEAFEGLVCGGIAAIAGQRLVPCYVLSLDDSRSLRGEVGEVAARAGAAQLSAHPHFSASS